MTTWGNWSAAGSNSFRIGWDAAIDDGNRVNMWVRVQNQYNVSGDATTISWDGTFSGSQNPTITASSGGETLILAVVPGRMSYNSTATVNFHLRGLYNGSTPDVTMSIYLGPLPPTSPSAPTATRISDSQVNLSWTNNITSDRPYDSIAVYRNEGSGFGVISTLAGSAVSYSDTTTVADRRYQYDILANNAAGGSGGTVGSAFIYTTPAAPTSLVATKDGSGNIVLTWTNNTSYASYATITVEESTNGGTTWPNVLTSSLSGTTATYTHATPSTGTSHTYRVKAVSPTSIASTYATSNTVTLLAAPNAPTPDANPINAHATGTVLDAAYATTLTWTHNPTDSTPQTAYEVSYQVSTDSGSTWGTAVSTGQVTSTTSSRTISAATWTNGAARRVRWQVRTWGTFGTPSAYSAFTTLTTNAIPVATITSGSTYTSPVIAVTGTYSDPEATAQTSAIWSLRNSSGITVESNTLSSGFLSYTFSFVPPDGTNYTVAYQVKDTTGQWSIEATKAISVAYAVPPTPTIPSISFDIATGKVTGTIANGTPVGGQVAAVSNRVYRDGVPVPELLAVAPNGTFIDSPPLNSTVVYSVYAASAYPSYSAPVTSTVTTLSSPLVQVLTTPSVPAGWYVDGVNLSTKAFNIENRSAGWSMPAPLGENIKVPGRHGAFYVADKPFDETELNLNMWAIGATSDGLIPKDSTAQQQCLRNLDGLSSIFGRGRLLEITRSSAIAEEGLINRVINPSFRGSSSIADWSDLLPGWAASMKTSTIYNFFNNPNLSTLNTTLSKNTDGTRTAVTVGGVSKYAAMKTAAGTGALSISITGTVTSAPTAWVTGATLWDSGAPALSGDVTITAVFKSSTTTTFTASTTVQYVKGKTFYVIADIPPTVAYDNYVITFTTASVTTGTNFGIVDPFFNSARAWTQGLAGDMAATPTQTYSWVGTANDSASLLTVKSKFGYRFDSSPRIVDGMDIGASLTSLTDYTYAPYLALAGPNNQELSLSVDASGKTGQWLYFNLDAELTRTPFSLRVELWNSGNMVGFQTYGNSADGPTSFSTDGMMRAPAPFSRVIIRFSPIGINAVTPQFYIGGQTVKITNLTLLLESQTPILTAGYVPRYFPSEQLTSASVAGVIPRSYLGYMLIAPKAGPVSVSLTDGTTVQGPYTITEPTVINPAWTAGWTYSVIPNGNLYHISTGYRLSDTTTLAPPRWDGTRFIDSPIWDSSKKISNAAGWINALSNVATRSATAYLPNGTTSYTYTSPNIALEAGTTRLSGSLTIKPNFTAFSSITSAGVKSSVTYAMTVSLMSYTSAAGASPTTLKTQTITSPTTISWIDVPTSTLFAGVKISLTVTSSVAIPFGEMFTLSDFMLVTTPTPRVSPVPFFDGDTVGCSWAGARYQSPSIYGGSIRRAFAEVSDAIDFSSMAGGSRAAFNVTLRIPNVFWEDPATTTVNSSVVIPANVDFEVPLTQFSGSSAPIEDATVRITVTSGTSTSLSISDKATGASLIITKALAVGSIITIVGSTSDTNAFSVTDQDGVSLVPYLVRRNTARFLPLTPMTPLQVTNAQAPVLVLRSDGAISATVSVSGHRKFFLA